MPDYPLVTVDRGAFDTRQLPSVSSLQFAARYNAEARRLFLPPFSAKLTTATLDEMGTTNVPFLDFPDAATSIAVWNYQHPIESHGRPCYIRLYWAQSGTSTGAFRIIITASLWAVGQLMSTGAGAGLLTQSIVLITGSGVADTQALELVIPSSLVVPEVALQDHTATLRLQRTGANGADTNTGSLKVLGIEVSHA